MWNKSTKQRKAAIRRKVEQKEAQRLRRVYTVQPRRGVRGVQ